MGFLYDLIHGDSDAKSKKEEESCGDMILGVPKTLIFIPTKSELNKALQLGELNSYATHNRALNETRFKAYVTCQSAGRQSRILNDVHKCFVDKVMGSKDIIDSEDEKKEEDTSFGVCTVIYKKVTIVKSPNGRKFLITTSAKSTSEDSTVVEGVLSEYRS